MKLLPASMQFIDNPHAGDPVVIHIRRNKLISQRIEVALIYKEMLGVDEARAYLAQDDLCANMIERILGNGPRRRSPEKVAESGLTPAATSFTVCRRKNHLHDAIVTAAVKIEGKLGKQWALALLKNEGVPEDVVERVLAEGPRQLRCRKAPCE
jgi:hypothetical protein